MPQAIGTNWQRARELPRDDFAKLKPHKIMKLKTPHFKEIRLMPIGVIHSPFKQATGTPIQPCRAGNSPGYVVLRPEFTEGLQDLDGFDRVWLIYWFHRASSAKMSVIPYRDTVAHGLFATRVPARPNTIGMSCVRLLNIEGNILRLADIVTGIKDHAVLFDLGDRLKSVCLYELTCVHGSSRDMDTQLALDFVVLVDEEVDGDAVEYGGNFKVPVADRPKLIGETLALTGGTGGGDWKWGETAMNLGVTVVHAQTRQSSTSKHKACQMDV